MPAARSPPARAQWVPRQSPAPSRGAGRPQRSLWADPRGAASLPRVKDVKLCSLQRSVLTKDRHAKQWRKTLRQPVPPWCCLPRRGAVLTPRAAGSPLRVPAPARRLPSACRAGPRAMALRKPALGTGTAQRWPGAQAGLGPAHSPLLSRLLPPWLWVLSIPNRLGFQRLFNSFLGSAFSLHTMLVWFHSLPFHFQPAKNADSTDCALCKGWTTAGQCPTLGISGWTR